MRWRIERAGTADHYAPGWFAFRLDENGDRVEGAYHGGPTAYDDALAFVMRQLGITPTLMTRAVVKLRGAVT
jgi:hypothetical protein